MTLGNSVYLGVAEDVRMRNALIGQSTPDWLEQGESIFAVAYLFEIILRIAVQRCEFFRGEAYRWNIFETNAKMSKCQNAIGEATVR